MGDVVLVVEDDARIGELVCAYLAQAGYDPRWARSGQQALELPREYVLAVLDLGLPDQDGLELLPSLNVPVVVLTARDEEADRIAGLEVGADDYVTKPFSPRELVARVKAVLRRARAVPAATGGHALRLGHDVELTPAAREVRVKGVAVDLTPREYELLAYLARRVNVAVSRDELLEAVWGFLSPGETRTVDVHVASIRRRLGQPGLIRTVRGVGYKAVA
jgi:two-component system alkaline phosphatase synthesis response regulator PhoP